MRASLSVLGANVLMHETWTRVQAQVAESAADHQLALHAMARSVDAQELQPDRRQVQTRRGDWSVNVNVE